MAVVKYKEVYDWILEHIRKGEWKAGTRLPSENTLSSQFGLSRQTVRHAVDLLEQQKIVSRIQGSGTYVGPGRKEGRQKRYGTVAVISTYMDSYIFPSVLMGIEKNLAKKGYAMQMAFTGNQVGREREILIHLLTKDSIDGLIVEPAKSALPNPNLDLYRTLGERGIPVLFFNSRYPDLDFPCVSMDDELAGMRAVQYLIGKGHRKIGGLFKSDDGQGHLRYKGFLTGMLEAGLGIRDQSIIWLDTEDLDCLYKWKDYLFDRLRESTAMVCYNDQAAWALYRLCEERGISVPGDLSLISIDNSELALLPPMGLTSFSHPMEALGGRAAEHMAEMIENPCFDGNYLFEPQVVERGSVAEIG